MNARAASGGHTDPGQENLLEGYEELRGQALGEPGRGLGFALFLRRGMLAWMESWRSSGAQTNARPNPGAAAAQRLPFGIRGEVTMVLAAMALNGRWEVMA